MPSLYFWFIILLLTTAIILILVKLAPLFGLIDIPNERKKHSYPTPLVGGLAIYLIFIIEFSFFSEWGSTYGKLIAWAGLIFIIGLLDDIKKINWFIRIIFQIIATYGVIFSTNIQIITLGNYPLFGDTQLGGFSYFMTFFAVVSITNSFNFLDGIDGLCGSLVLILLSVLLLLIFIFSGAVNFYLLMFIIPIGVFLFFNLSSNRKLKIFLGDAGSTTFGFIISFVVIHVFQIEVPKLTAPLALWLFFLPILDTVFVTISRAVNGESIFYPTNKHVHHLLISLGLSHRKTLVTLIIISILAMIMGIILNSFSDLISILFFFTVFLFCFFYLNKIKN